MKRQLDNIAIVERSASVRMRNALSILSRFRFALSDEKSLQAEIAQALTNVGVAFEREVRLSAADIVDFMVDDVAVEVKIKGQRRAIYRQLERYCAHERVGAILLATNVAMGLPDTIAGKPTAVLNLGRGWL